MSAKCENDRRIAENRQDQWHRHLYRWPCDEGRLDRRTTDVGAYGGYRLVFRRRKAPQLSNFAGRKNRFGSTNEIIFEMEEGGLKEVANPSQVFWKNA